MEPRGRIFRVHGEVQGVGFRWWTRSRALRLGLSGSVSNLPDGSVEVRAAGTAEAIARLREELYTGPDSARVERVEETDWADGARAAGFEITRHGGP